MKRILISACLLGENCKYSGGNNLCPQAAELAEAYQLVPVCPEQLGGLPTPRPPAERQGEKVCAKTGADVTDAYRKGAEEARRLGQLLQCEGALLKARSPSCGKGKIYDGSFTGTVIDGNGVTAELLEAAGIPVYTEDEIEELERL